MSGPNGSLYVVKAYNITEQIQKSKIYSFSVDFFDKVLYNIYVLMAR